MQPSSRRRFLKQSITLSAAAAAYAACPVSTALADTSGKTRSIRLGGPAYASTNDPAELARAHRKLGYRAAYCPNVSTADSDKVRAFADAFAAQDVVIAEVGCWCNLMDADRDVRRKNLATVTDGLALAEAIGARCCVDIAGSFNPKVWYGPDPRNFSTDFFDLAVENARKIIDEVKPKRTVFAYEMMGWAFPDTPESYLKLIKAIDRKAFGVHLDPCNAINCPEKFYDNTALLNHCFDKLGKWIASCHAKDLAWEVEMNVHFREVIPGQGKLDYATYLRRIAQLPQQPPLMLEHLSTAEEYAQGREHILQVGRQNGLSFE